jgi:hypothetical protein
MRESGNGFGARLLRAYDYPRSAFRGVLARLIRRNRAEVSRNGFDRFLIEFRTRNTIAQREGWRDKQ